MQLCVVELQNKVDEINHVHSQINYIIFQREHIMYIFF
jgi:hypothetical protein